MKCAEELPREDDGACFLQSVVLSFLCAVRNAKIEKMSIFILDTYNKVAFTSTTP